MKATFRVAASGCALLAAGMEPSSALARDICPIEPVKIIGPCPPGGGIEPNRHVLEAFTPTASNRA